MPESRPVHDFPFALRQLVEKDFKIRYRNMSLGIFWSLLNPLIMMSVLTFVFTVVFQSPQKLYPLFLLMGLLPYSFFSQAWSAATTSVVGNSVLIKKVSFPRELLPISVVLASSVHFLIQLGLLLAATAIFVGVTPMWIWLPLIVALHIVFTCGLSLLFAALDVFYRDTLYVVESATLVVFWLAPIFYSFDQVARVGRDVPGLSEIYSLNPVAAVILLTRRVLLYEQHPGWMTVIKFAVVSSAVFAFGMWFFKKKEKEFVDHL